MDNREVIILNVVACLWYDNHWIQDIRNDGWPLISRIPKVQITWLVHGWWRSTHNEQPRHQDFQSLDGGSWHREVLPPLMISEVTSQLPFADSLYREQFSGVLAGHHSWNVGYSIHPEKQQWHGHRIDSCGRVSSKLGRWWSQGMLKGNAGVFLCVWQLQLIFWSFLL